METKTISFYDVMSVRLGDITGKTGLMADVLSKYRGAKLSGVCSAKSPAGDHSNSDTCEHATRPDKSDNSNFGRFGRFSISKLSGIVKSDVSSLDHQSGDEGLNSEDVITSSDTETMPSFIEQDQLKPSGLKTYIARAIRKRDSLSPRDMNVLAPTSM